MTRRPAIVSGLVLLLAAALFTLLRVPEVVSVSPGDDVSEVLGAAPEGAVIRLAPGEYSGPLTVSQRLSLEGSEAVISVDAADGAAITVAADGVILEGLEVRGGKTGIIVRESEGVELSDVSVRGTEMHGIEVIDASARLSGVNVEGLRSAFAQGIEIRNSDGRPDSSVIDSTVVGGQEGIVSHVSEVEIRGNTVSETTMRGIAVTEMSDGIVKDNIVLGAAGTAYYCGDMSRCQFEGNTSDEVVAGDLGNSSAGWGLVVQYHAVASTEGDTFHGIAGHTYASLDGRLANSTPLEIGAGRDALVPIGITTVVALTVLLVLFRVSRRVNLTEGDGAGSWKGFSAVLGLVGLSLFAVQSFHMFEHLLQVYRVHVDGVPSRGGLVGPSVEAEWVHFLLNAAVLTLLVSLLYARRKDWTPPGATALGDRAMVVVVALQGYHMVEHSVKLGQHLIGGAKVNDGIGGAIFDLVLYHYALNLMVYLTMAIAVAAYLWPQTMARSSVARVSLRRGPGVQGG